MSNQRTLKRMATQLGLPLEHNPAKEDEHGLCGCVECYLAWTAKPPPVGELEQIAQNLRVIEMFNGYQEAPSQDVQALLDYVAKHKGQQNENAKPGQPRRSRKQEAKLTAAKAAGKLVPEGEITKERLVISREDWIYRKGTAWGWLEHAAKVFRLSQKTIRSRMAGTT